MTGADGVFNIAKGRVNEYVNRIDSNDPTNSALIVVLLKTVEVDATLEDYDDLGALLTATGNVEADFTNYARKTIDDTGLVAPTPDDTNNRQESDITTDPVWTSAGNATNNTLVKLLVCYDSDTGTGTDANIIPLTFHTFDVTTDGNDLTAQLDAAGFYRAS